jgi:hypothetical protein
MYASLDGGDTWKKLAAAGSRAWQSVACSADGSRVVAVEYDGWLGYIHTSSDFGRTWHRKAVGSSNWRSVACSADASRIIAVAYNGPVVLSKDFGSSWVFPDSKDFGSSWVFSDEQPWQNWQAVACSADGMTCAAVMELGWLFVSTNGGETWVSFPFEEYWRSVDCTADGNTIVAVSKEGRRLTVKFSEEVQSFVEDSSRWIGVAISDNASSLAAVASGEPVSMSTDGGESWAFREESGARAWTNVAMSGDGIWIGAA